MIKSISVKLNPILILGCITLFGACVNASGNAEFNRFSECPASPNCVSSFADPSDEEHYIEPFNFNAELPVVYEQVYSYLSLRSDVEIIISEKNAYIHAVFTSKIFKFRDDVEFAFKTDEDNSVVVDIQSRSRLGYSDMGVNRKRMEEIRTTLRN